MFRHLRSSETIHHRLSGDTTWVGKHVKENEVFLDVAGS